MSSCNKNKYQLTDKFTNKVYVGTAEEIECALKKDIDSGIAEKSITAATIRKYGKRNQAEGWSSDHFEVGLLEIRE